MSGAMNREPMNFRHSSCAFALSVIMVPSSIFVGLVQRFFELHRFLMMACAVLESLFSNAAAISSVQPTTYSR